MVGILLKISLDARVRCRKDRCRSNLGEQLHQIRDWPRIELLHGLDQPASKILIGERLAQPMEFLHGSVPRQRVCQTTLPADLLLCQGPLLFGVDRYSGTDLSW